MAARIAGIDVRAVLGGAFAQNRARTAVAAFAIALGVALGLAVQLVNGTAIEALAQGVRTLSGDADLTVRGPRGGFDEGVYARLAQDRDVAIASPAVEVDVRVRGQAESLRIIGIDAFRAGAIQPALLGATSDRLDVLRPDALFLSNAAMTWSGAAAGERLPLQGGSHTLDVRIAGSLVGAGQPRLGVMDIAAVQDAFDREGVLTRIDLRLVSGADRAAVQRRLASMLPAGVSVDPPETTSRATERISRSYRINLNVLALVALFTGGLLVFSTQALSAVRRRSQFALLRTLGMTRRRLATLCALEGTLIGAAGSTAGLGAGYMIAVVAVRVVGADLGAGYFGAVDAGVSVDVATLAMFFALGVLAATLGSVVPAIEAARAAPARALKAGDEESAFAHVYAVRRGLIVIALGAAMVLLPPVDGIPVFGYAAIACLLVGTLLVMPGAARALLARIPRASGAPQALALAQLRSAPGQMAASLASIVASVALMVSMAVMVASFRQSLDDWLGQVLPASLYVRVPGAEAAFTPQHQARIASVPGVSRADFVREEQLLLDASRPRVALLARPLPDDDAPVRMALVDGPIARPSGAPPAVWVNEAMVDLYGFSPGRIVTLPIAGRAVAFHVSGVWRDYARPHGAVQIDRDVHVSLTGDRRATTAALWLHDETALPRVVEALRAALPGASLDVSTPGEIRALSLAAFDRTFAVTYALELAGVAIGLVGLSSAFGALVLARRREFGVLRHLGMTRRQVAAMLATEGALTSAIGVAAGMLLGFVVSLVLIHVVNRQSFHWGMSLTVPGVELAAFAIVVVLLATLTAIASGRHAMGDDVVRAVKEDW